MIHWVEVKETYNARQVLMFSDSFDPLVAAGWSIVALAPEPQQQVAERSESVAKRAAPGSPEPEETPSKKSRTGGNST
jgi:hypothetical protein